MPRKFTELRARMSDIAQAAAEQQAQKMLHELRQNQQAGQAMVGHL